MAFEQSISKLNCWQWFMSVASELWGMWKKSESLLQFLMHQTEYMSFTNSIRHYSAGVRIYNFLWARSSTKRIQLTHKAWIDDPSFFPSNDRQVCSAAIMHTQLLVASWWLFWRLLVVWYTRTFVTTFISSVWTMRCSAFPRDFNFLVLATLVFCLTRYVIQSPHF